MDPEFTKKIRDLPMVVGSGEMSVNKTGSWSLMKPEFSTKYPPCQEGCPAHVPIREIMSMVQNKDFELAAYLFTQSNPFPAITGRVCHHPCQLKCLRDDYDGTLEIRAIERLLGKYSSVNAEIESEKTERIAVIGSGPSGLACAYYLRLQGYSVTIFEKEDKTGGLLRYGIPPYRLPGEVLDTEMERLSSMGIIFKTNVRVDSNLLIGEIADYDAVFIGIGAHLSKDLRLSGNGAEKVLSGLDFLNSYENFRTAFNKKKIAVIGGGNTAMDAARTAIRFGADVEVVYRRTLSEMPAIKEEIDGAIEEGCRISYLSAPESVNINGDKLELSCIRMELGAPDDSGRRKPIPVPDSLNNNEYDYIISAIGEDPDFKGFNEVVTIKNNSIKINYAGNTGQTLIFAGGDAAGYTRSVVDAIASGKKAANSINSVLQNKDIGYFENKKSSLKMEDINTNYFDPQKAADISSIPSDKRVQNFKEIVSDINEDQAFEESKRCFSCGACTHCDNCVIYCPDFAVLPNHQNYEIKEEYCKGCGICIKECPRGVMKWKQTPNGIEK